MNNRAVVTTTVGYMCWTLMLWMVCLPGTFLFAGTGEMLHTPTAIAYPLAIVLAVAGIFTYLQGRTLDAIVFLAGTALFWSFGMLMAGAMDPVGYIAWYELVWAVFFAYVGFGSLKADMLRMLFLFAVALNMLLDAIHFWGGSDMLAMVANYVGLIAAILAILVSARAVMDHGAGGDPNRA
ncbi:MAG TPA: hypothetical protein VFJ04_01875 [Rhodanobacteraceae bacterium]|jgi:succinate-acetate transporter protein|nr:hypothetical protein [Rhodanobacteraceae bacterium]